MKTDHARRGGFTLIELLVVVAIIALLVSILLPSLARAKDLAKAMVCANNAKATCVGFTYYANEFNGVWMAPWNTNRPPWVDEPHTYSTQWPYTMMLYVTGNALPMGTTVWDDRYGGWYSPEGHRHGWPPEYGATPEEAPQMHCPEMVARGEAENFWFYNTTSFSHFVPLRWNQDNHVYEYHSEAYPKQDFMTHPGSTVHLMCLSGILDQGATNAWMHFEGYPSDPHMGKSNYVFCDGHIETLDVSATTERMWQDQWDPDDQ